MDRRTAPRLLATLALTASLAACGGTDDEAAGTLADQISTDLSVEPDVPPSEEPAPEELVVGDVVAGDGAEATDGTTAQVKYVGALYENGEEFDSSWSRGEDSTYPVTLGEGGVIPGFEQGIEGMQVGGRRVVTIPSDLGYGPAGAGDAIPGDATLVFVIDLVEVTD
ncbi:FKBP-type peptidyl-prolyl cis-trans isomerase [Modestobacter roseus]|uniref:Peptidyl-prolyl cis-trans isomerase n=1 Tax=Modestobacter roseus TaxID=1181884 RepID=A0A562IXG5_9ACTN|nr:FKBP-type peptidyl-prolyl cis-trans isomerase [Modestobacter roseus]MQA34814.1 FKBP-type peptidyl-prolyl cis-trans isomerase [Modestobacter roseus]TWH75556.1 peptidylprolyl isomerase [Modestobacter roseus]